MASKVVARPLVTLLSFSAALLIPLLYGCGGLRVSSALSVIALVAMSLVVGKALARMLDASICSLMQSDAAAFVIGYLLLSIFHLFATAVFNLSAGSALLCDVMLATGSLYLVVSRWSTFSKNSLDDSTTDRWRSTAFECALIVLIGCLTTFWLRESLVAVAEAKQSGIFRAWSDFLLQAAEISYQVNYPDFGGQGMYMTGFPQPIYHRASYSLAAAYVWLSGESPLEAAMYFWLPVSFVLMGAGAYQFAKAIGGRLAGLVSVLALFLLPDASMYGLKNGYFAFYWLLAVAPGAGYALAVSFVTLAFYIYGINQNQHRYLIAVGACVALVCTLFRMQIAVLLISAYALLFIVNYSKKICLIRYQLIFGLITLAVSLVWTVETFPAVRDFLGGENDGIKYINAVHLAVPTAYEGFFDRVAQGHDTVWRSGVGYLLLLVAQHGILLPLVFLGAALYGDKKHKWHIFMIIASLVIVHALITFLMPTPRHGDITEWSHRSFVLIHAVLVVIIAVFIVKSKLFRWLVSSTEYRPFIRGGLISSVILLGLIVPWVFGKNLQYGTLRDGPTACANRISPEMFAAAEYIRKTSSPGEIVVAADGDPSAVLVALTGLQAYVSRIGLYEKLGGIQKEQAESRMNNIALISHASSIDQLKEFGKRTGVRWFVMVPALGEGTSPMIEKYATYKGGDIAVFDLMPDGKYDTAGNRGQL